MKRIYLLGLTIIYTIIGNAQTSIKLRTSVDQELRRTCIVKNSEVTSTSQITGSISCITQYVAGTTMDLVFSLDLSNTDNEYGDLVTITFPVGIIPNTSASNTPSVGTGAAYIEMLNPIVGQSISWGDNDNTYGGIVPGNSYSLQVNVTISNNITGPQTVTYDVSGDIYGATPGDLIGGTTTIYPANTTGINMYSQYAISIFPNPTTGIINVNAVEVSCSVEVFNVIGEKVYSNNLVKGNNALDLSSVANGAYFVKLISNGAITTKKVVLSK